MPPPPFCATTQLFPNARTQPPCARDCAHQNTLACARAWMCVTTSPCVALAPQPFDCLEHLLHSYFLSDCGLLPLANTQYDSPPARGLAIARDRSAVVRTGLSFNTSRFALSLRTVSPAAFSMLSLHTTTTSHTVSACAHLQLPWSTSAAPISTRHI